MKTMELDTCRIELIRDILATDDLQVLRTVRRAYRRAVNKMMKSTDADNLPAYTMEELNARLDEAGIGRWGNIPVPNSFLRWSVKCPGYASRMEKTSTA